MGCGGSTRAIAPQDACVRQKADRGFSSIVPERATSDPERAWEEADKAPNDDRLPHMTKDADDDEQKQPENSSKEDDLKQPLEAGMSMKQPEEDALKDVENDQKQPVEASRFSAQDSGMHPQHWRERLSTHRAAGRPQAPLAASPQNIIEQQGKGKEEAPKHAERVHTARQLICVTEHKKSDLNLCLSENIVPEPLNLQDYNSFKYTPTREHFAEGHPLAPCLPSHQKHVRKIQKSVVTFAKFPDKFKDLIFERRHRESEDRDSENNQRQRVEVRAADSALGLVSRHLARD